MAVLTNQCRLTNFIIKKIIYSILNYNSLIIVFFWKKRKVEEFRFQHKTVWRL